MKKFLLALGLVAFFMTSCCDKQKGNESCEHKCKGQHEECDHHGPMPGVCPEMMAEMDVMINALANWEDLDEDQHAEAISMAKKHVEMKANMPKPECKKGEGEGGCCGKKHEGCQHQHGNCEHHQDK